MNRVNRKSLVRVTFMLTLGWALVGSQAALAASPRSQPPRETRRAEPIRKVETARPGQAERRPGQATKSEPLPGKPFPAKPVEPLRRPFNPAADPAKAPTRRADPPPKKKGDPPPTPAPKPKRWDPPAPKR